MKTFITLLLFFSTVAHASSPYSPFIFQGDAAKSIQPGGLLMSGKLGIDNDSPQGAIHVGANSTAGTVHSTALILGSPDPTADIPAYAVVFGSGNANSAQYSIASGLNNALTAAAMHSLVSGKNNIVSNENTIVGGDNNTVRNYNTVVAGNNNNCQGSDGICAGFQNQFVGDGGAAFGTGNLVALDNAVAGGYLNTSADLATVAFGTGNIAGNVPVAGAIGAPVEGVATVVFTGNTNTALLNTASFRVYNCTGGSNNTLFYLNATAALVQVVGDDIHATFGGSIFDDRTSCEFAMAYQSSNAVAMGNETKASGINSFSMGYFSRASGINSWAFGNTPLASGANSAAMGTKAQAIHAGAVVITDGQAWETSSDAADQIKMRAGGGFKIVAGGGADNDDGVVMLDLDASGNAIFGGTVEGSNLSGTNTGDQTVNGYNSGTILLDTSDIAEGTRLYYTAARFNTAFSGKSTTNLAEGSNLYYTETRFDSSFSGKTSSDLSEGTNLYYTEPRFDSSFSGKSTADLAEITNLYYTESRVSSNTDVSANTAARHNAVTIGTANGLSLSTQVLSLAAATSSTAGALTSVDQVLGGMKSFNDGPRLSTSGAQPSCDSAHRGLMWNVEGGAGVADLFQICQKNVADAYVWTTH